MRNEKKTNLSNQVYHLIKDKILTGEFAGGSKIPEETLAEQFNVSRTPIREAVRRLSEYGLVVIKPRSHAIVKEVDEKEAQDIASVRICLEQLAVDTITEESLVRHREEISRRAADCLFAIGIANRALVYENDSLFHMAIIKASENDILVNMYKRLDAQIQQLRIVQNLPDIELSGYIDQHSQIIQLLNNGDKDLCKKALIEHILHGF